MISQRAPLTSFWGLHPLLPSSGFIFLPDRNEIWIVCRLDSRGILSHQKNICPYLDQYFKESDPDLEPERGSFLALVLSVFGSLAAAGSSLVERTWGEVQRWTRFPHKAPWGRNIGLWSHPNGPSPVKPTLELRPQWTTRVLSQCDSPNRGCPGTGLCCVDWWSLENQCFWKSKRRREEEEEQLWRY